MSQDLSQKEILLRLMDKVDAIGTEQSNHVAYTRSKLENIEAEAFKTNGRVTKLEEEVDAIQVRQENLGTKVAAGVFIASTVMASLINRFL